MSDSPETQLAPNSRHSIRRDMRQRRRALSPADQLRAARQLNDLLGRQPAFQRSQDIAFYIANDGEIDPRYLLLSALHQGKRCYLPVLDPEEAGKLWFLPYTEATPLNVNRFGIAEPAVSAEQRMSATDLDLVLLPLVAYDRSGARLGMGAGYYDRCFAFKAAQPYRKPALLGLAHSCQEAVQLPVEPWDIPLQAIATESGLISCGNKEQGRDFLARDLL